jgi:hypothetical protein
MNKGRAIGIIKKIIEDNKEIGLGLGEIGSASWKSEPTTNEQWKHIGYVTAYSDAFDITPEDLSKKNSINEDDRK